MERKSYRFALAQVDAAARTFSGHASIFGIPDDGAPPDSILPGAFAKTIKEWGPGGANRIKVLALHRYDWLPIGKPLVLHEDQAGLAFEAQVSDTALGRDVLTLIADGVITEMSIGFDPIKWEYDQAAGVRRIEEIRLWEISPVTWAMHPQARIETVKELLAGLRHDGAALAEIKALLGGPEPAPVTPALAGLSDPAVRQSLVAINADLKQVLAARR